MKRGGYSKVDQVVEDFRTKDEFDSYQLEEIFSYGAKAVPHLEKILKDALSQSDQMDLIMPPKNLSWFAPAHALFMLAHLRSEKSLNLILEFLSQKEKKLNYWLHDLLNDEIWEVIYMLGRDQLDKLQAFVLNKRHDCLARLAVCTALVQIALNFESKKDSILDIFKGLLRSKNEDPEFIGLLVSELMDLKDDAIRSLMLRALQRNFVWAGIISPDEVNSGFQNKNVRKREPLDSIQRFEYLKQYYTYSSKASVRTFPKKVKRGILEKSH